eukprot:jgi/Galph1/5867/GphlegSOOS_G4427.1
MSLRIVSGGYDHTIRLWDAAAGTNDLTFPFNESQVNQVQFSADGRLVAVCGNPRVCFYDVQSGSQSPVRVLEYHRSNVSKLVFRRDGPFALSCSEDGLLCEWDLRGSEPVRVCDNESPLSGVVYGNGKEECFSCDYDGSIKIWCLNRKRVLARLILSEREPLSSIVFDPMYHLAVTTGNNGYAYISRVETEESKRQVNGAAVDENYFTRVTKLQCSKRYVLKACFNTDTSLLVTAADDGNIRLWGDSSASSEEQDRYQENRWRTSRLIGKHQKWAWDCLFTRDSKFVFSASSDKRICLWEVENGDLMKEYKGHQKAVISIDTFSTTQINETISRIFPI